MSTETRPLIVVADDHDESREVLAELLEQRGYAVRIAADGAEAIALVTELLPALAIVDIAMPEADGIMVLRHLRANERTRAVPIVALTAYGRDSWVAPARLLFDAFFTKPIDVDELLRVVAELVAPVR